MLHDGDSLRPWLEALRDGQRSVDEVLEALRARRSADLGFARVDHERRYRCGFPEVILCEHKTAEQVRAISREILSESNRLLATRVNAETLEVLTKEYPEAESNREARTFVVDRRSEKPRVGKIALVTAGTTDIPVAEEARVTAELMDAQVETIYDVGVAGLHRLLAETARLREARVLIVVAGMEGALPSVVAGLVDRPVIAVPTSNGYGASFGGLAALLAMMNSCAAGVTVVNIDNGFGAGFAAALINRDA